MCAECVSPPRCHSKTHHFQAGLSLLNLQEGKNLFLLLWSRCPSWEWVEICISFVHTEILKGKEDKVWESSMLMCLHLGENVCWIFLMHLNIKLHSAWLEPRKTPLRCP